MLATSWKATGLLQPIWNKLPVEKDKRGELSRITGIPATNLSGINTGRLPMTMDVARRIVAAVPGVTVLDLGAPEVADDQESRWILDRLAALEEQALTVESLRPVWRILLLLATGKRAEALRELSAAGVAR